jgi:hypothetical protein
MEAEGRKGEMVRGEGCEIPSEEINEKENISRSAKFSNSFIHFVHLGMESGARMCCN